MGVYEDLPSSQLISIRFGSFTGSEKKEHETEIAKKYQRQQHNKALNNVTIYKFIFLI